MNAEVRDRGVCERIKAEAARQQLTTAELAARADVSTRVVYKVNHALANLRPATVGKFAKALGVTTEWLLHGTEPKRETQDATRGGGKKAAMVRELSPGYGDESSGWIGRAIRILEEEENELRYSSERMGMPVSEVMRRIGERLEEEEPG